VLFKPKPSATKKTALTSAAHSPHKMAHFNKHMKIREQRKLARGIKPLSVTLVSRETTASTQVLQQTCFKVEGVPFATRDELGGF
jgi:hypothetical protein